MNICRRRTRRKSDFMHSNITPSLQWASIAVAHARPQKARDANALLTMESSPQRRIWVFSVVFIPFDVD
ncbi:hypothetical protein Y032_0122g1083 [Ancylostoma ceylanicum]|nr:hypothetical protein Y032_0122g1083 [Ancylostoma ceylanicum]